MSDRGFALITVLWVIAAFTALSGAGLAALRLGSVTSGNRVYLARAAWAREACVDILLARVEADSTTTGVDTIDLGRGSWCTAELHDTGAKLNLNLIDRDGLIGLLERREVEPRSEGASSRTAALVDAALDWRDADDEPRPAGAEAEWYVDHGRRPPRNGPFAHVAELIYVRGFDMTIVQRLERLLTVRGSGAINVPALPTGAVFGLSMLPPGGAALLADAKRAGVVFASHEEVARYLAESQLRIGLADYRALVRETAFYTTQLVGVVTGGVRETGLTASTVVMLAPGEGRIGVVRRETE
jgi:type II secretory pathway component PulK